MPYIKTEDRLSVDLYLAPQTAGELNYLFTRFANEYILRKGTNYQACNDIVGALEGCKLEFYRRLVGTYEDLKIKENGDVYYL